MGSCAAPSAKGDDKFITTDYLQQCPISYRRSHYVSNFCLLSGFHSGTDDRKSTSGNRKRGF
ncbi:hypothetical protein EIZ35_24835 [Escherichia coli]|nr:hypothetical protein [Escherichia coli]